MRIPLTMGLVLGACFVRAGELPATLPPHPRLLFATSDIPRIKQRIATHNWARVRFDSLKSQADGWLKTDIKLPPRGGQWFHYYSCPKHGARLRTEGPTRHVCPIDGEVLTGYPYDDVVLMSEHSRLAGAVRTLGVVHQLTGETRYAEKAKEILLAYASKYESYPLHNIKGEERIGGGKVGPQTLDESTWLISMAEGADCIWNTLTAAEQRNAEQHLFRPATDIIQRHKMGIHNIQCWKNSAVGLTGLLLGDSQLVNKALSGEAGYFQQMAKGTTADGAWYEGAWGYHFYTVSAVSHLTEGAFHSGIDLYGPEFKRMFDAPLDLAMPNLELPAFNDSHEVSIPGSASLYEMAFARYQDPRYQLVLARGKRDSDAALMVGREASGRANELVPTSRNFPASGFAILAGGQGNDTTWLCLDYGAHGGGHGHPDKLGFVLYGLGRVIAPDPGTANYGVPIQAGWYRTTIAHNTLTVDERSQQPAEGKCETFLAAKDFSAVSATAGKIYKDVSFRRTLALIDGGVLVCIDQARSTNEHTFDLAYHNVGKLVGRPSAERFHVPTNAGYSYFRDAMSLSTADGFEAIFDLGRGQQTRWAMAGGRPTAFIVATGVGAHTEDRVPLVIARSRGTEMNRFWCVTLGQSAEKVSLTEEPLTQNGSHENSALAVCVKTRAATHILVVNPLAERVVVKNQLTTNRLAHLISDGQGGWMLQHAVP